MSKKYLVGCVLICKRPDFWQYLMRRSCRLVASEDEALKVVRILTGIRSRKELVTDPNAAIEWQNLITDFNKWTTKQ
ncbi:MAG: hypothetical protein ACRCUF_04355 [Aeromonas sobria]